MARSARRCRCTTEGCSCRARRRPARCTTRRADRGRLARTSGDRRPAIHRGSKWASARQGCCRRALSPALLSLLVLGYSTLPGDHVLRRIDLSRMRAPRRASSSMGSSGLPSRHGPARISQRSAVGRLAVAKVGLVFSRLGRRDRRAIPDRQLRALRPVVTPAAVRSHCGTLAHSSDTSSGDERAWACLMGASKPEHSRKACFIGA